MNTSDAEQFARALATDLMGRVPLATETQRPLTQERLKNAHEAIVARSAAYARTHKLNWLQKAKLGNTFRWQMLEKGYDKAFVDTWTHNVLVALATPAKRASGQ
jgi:hypothetical protein